MTISYRLFNIKQEDPNKIFNLFEAVYGSSTPLKKRWNWQYIDHPRSSEIKIVIAENRHRIVGITSHLPSDIMIEGKKYKGFYASDSMVHPEYRRRGIMKNIYKMCKEMMPIIYAKGTNPEMYKLRIRSGFKPVLPNSYMLNIISPFRWMLAKLIYRRNSSNLDLRKFSFPSDFQLIDKVDVEFDKFWNRVALLYPGIIIKNSAFMNWRYITHPYKKYYFIYIKNTNKIISVVVFRLINRTVHIVDIIWDPYHENNLVDSLKIINRQSNEYGVLKYYCWGTLNQLRHCLKKTGSFDTKNTPRLTIFSNLEMIDRLANGSTIHFVDGDGDSEYL